MLPIVIDTFNESTINRIKIIFYPNVSDRLFNGFPAVVCQVNILYLYLEIIANTCIWHYAISLHSRFSVHQVDIIKYYLDMFIARRLTTIKRNCFIFLFLHLKSSLLAWWWFIAMHNSKLPVINVSSSKSTSRVAS